MSYSYESSFGRPFRKKQAKGQAALGSTSFRFFTVITMSRDDGKGTKPAASLALAIHFL